MVSSLEHRLGRLERLERGSSASGGLHMIIAHVDDTPLPEPIKTGGLTITYVRDGDEGKLNG